MFKYPLIYLLIALILSQSLLRLGIYVDFKLRQDYIARALCINQDKPLLNCQGQCQLEARLQQTDDQDKPFSTTQTSVKEWVLFLTELPIFDWMPAEGTPAVQQGHYAYSLPCAPVRAVFHPPSVMPCS
ncbi:MAG: hypothetical protein ACFCUI_05810 [Bernardetiaceae bacterium]